MVQKNEDPVRSRILPTTNRPVKHHRRSLGQMPGFCCEPRNGYRVSKPTQLSIINQYPRDTNILWEVRTIFLRERCLDLRAFPSSRLFRLRAARPSRCVLNFCRNVTKHCSKAASRFLAPNSFLHMCLQRRRFSLISSKTRVFIRELWTDCFVVLSQTKRTGSIAESGVLSAWLPGSSLSVLTSIIRRRCVRITCWVKISEGRI